MLSKPTLIISVLLIVCSIGLFYFLVVPNLEIINVQAGKIEILEDRLEKTTNYFNEINLHAEKLDELDWTNLEKKIDSNFMSGPFYDYNMNIFIKNLVLNSGLSLENIVLAGNSSFVDKDSPIIDPSTVKSSGAVSGSSLKEASISLTLLGSYDNLKNFLNILSEQFCIVDINQIRIEAASSSEITESLEGEILDEDNLMKFTLEGNLYSE